MKKTIVCTGVEIITIQAALTYQQGVALRKAYNDLNTGEHEFGSKHRPCGRKSDRKRNRKNRWS